MRDDAKRDLFVGQARAEGYNVVQKAVFRC